MASSRSDRVPKSDNLFELDRPLLHEKWTGHMYILLIKLIKWFIQVRLLIERCYVIEKIGLGMRAKPKVKSDLKRLVQSQTCSQHYSDQHLT